MQKNTHSIAKSIFRAYDIRGIVNQDLDVEEVCLIGRALATYLQERAQSTIILGRDNRLSSPTLFSALKDGLLNSGCDVIDIGEVPTPVLYYATSTLNINNGAIITASHNSSDYNGIKIVVNKQALSAEAIQYLYKIIIKKQFLNGKGKYKKLAISTNYIDSIVNKFHFKKRMKVVLDCANAVACNIAPQLFERLGCEVIRLFCKSDGNFPNHQPDPSNKENLNSLVSEVKKNQAAIGIAYDGDADRVFVVDEQGQIISADQLIMLFAKQILARLPNSTLIYDIKCSQLVNKVITELGGQGILCRTGHTFIKAKIKELDAPFGGEASGHFIFNDNWYGFDDGFYATARLLEIIEQSHQPLSKLIAELPTSVITPEIKLPIEEVEKTPFLEKFKQQLNVPNAKIITIDGIRIEFPDCWGLIRQSNTEPFLIFRFEASDQTKLEFIRNLFITNVIKIKPELHAFFKQLNN